MYLDSLRNDLVFLRNEALSQGVFDWAVKLSHYIAAINSNIFGIEIKNQIKDQDFLNDLKFDLETIKNKALDITTPKDKALEQRIESYIVAIQSNIIVQIALYIPSTN